MKFTCAATVSSLALLASTALSAKQQHCPTIKTTLRNSVISGKFAHYTVNVVAGAQALDNAVSDRELLWDLVDLTSKKIYTFKVKVDVDDCAPSSLELGALVIGSNADNGCPFSSEPKYAHVKRSKKNEESPLTPPVLGLPTFCNGNGQCKAANAQCAFLPDGFYGLCQDQRTEGECLSLLSAFGMHTLPCSQCPAPFETPTCTATGSGDCAKTLQGTQTPGANTNCDYPSTTSQDTRHVHKPPPFLTSHQVSYLWRRGCPTCGVVAAAS
jgi:hypothetical protein